MMAAKQPGRRAARTRPGRLRWLPLTISIIVGLVAGISVAVVYPPPSSDMIKVQAAQWYQHMRQLLIPTSTTPRWVGDPQIYAAPPIEPPPAANTDDELVDDAVAHLVNVNAPTPQEHQLATALDDAATDLGLQHRMVVVDAATGQTLYDRGGNDAVVPASTVKLFTAISVLQHLDLNHRFTTSAHYTSDDGVRLVGGGDGLLALGQSTGETIGYAGLADLADQTWDAIADDLSADATTVPVTVDVSRYAQPTTHPSWTEGLMAAGWVSPVYPLNVYGGFTADPTVSSTAVDDGAAVAAAALTRHLNEHAAADDADVEFSYEGHATAAQQYEPVAHVQSATLGEQIEYAMKQSNNMLFEMFGREAALAAGHTPDFAGSTRTTMRSLTDLGIATQDLRFMDNSGLSPQSRATLHATADLFEIMLTQEQFRPLFHTLTIAGYDGTMRNRLDEPPYAGIVRSKTGTLEVGSSNAGLTETVDGRLLWFAINTTGADGDYAAARTEQDHLVEVLTECECTTN